MDDEFIYWGGFYGALGKRRLDASLPAVELIPEETKEVVQSLLLANDTLCWSTDSTNNGVRGCSLPNCTGGPMALIDGSVPSKGIAYDAKGGTLYWGEGKDIRQKQLPNGSTTNLTSLTRNVLMLGTDGVYVYAADYDNSTRQGAVYRVSLAGGQPNSLVSNLTYVTGLVAYDKTLYVLDSLGTDKAARVLAIPLPNGVGSGEPAVLAVTTDAYGLAVEESGAYWTTSGKDGSVSHCSLSGCENTPDILAPTTWGLGIATDEQALYWASGGKIMKLAK